MAKLLRIPSPQRGGPSLHYHDYHRWFARQQVRLYIGLVRIWPYALSVKEDVLILSADTDT